MANEDLANAVLGVMNDMMCHSLEAARYLLQDPDKPRSSMTPKTVSCDIATLKWTRDAYIRKLKDEMGVDYSKGASEDFARATVTWETDDGSPPWPERGSDEPSVPTTGPAGLRQRDPRTIAVLWHDGQQHHLDVRDLRLACRCAQCIEEMSGRPLLDPATVRADIAPRVITSVGNYAITIDWNDGHSTGIYSYRYLRHLGEQTTTLVAEDV